jgi:hypothetical protein
MSSAAAGARHRPVTLRWLRLAAGALAVLVLLGAVGVWSGRPSSGGLFLVAFLWWLGLPQLLHAVAAERFPPRGRLLTGVQAASIWLVGGGLAGGLFPFYGFSRWLGAWTNGVGALVALAASTAIVGAIANGTEQDVTRTAAPPGVARLNRRIRIAVLLLTTVVITVTAVALVGAGD